MSNLEQLRKILPEKYSSQKKDVLLQEKDLRRYKAYGIKEFLMDALAFVTMGIGVIAMFLSPGSAPSMGGEVVDGLFGYRNYYDKNSEAKNKDSLWFYKRVIGDTVDL